MSGKRAESKRRKAVARAKELQGPPRVAVFLGETKAGQALIEASGDEEMRLREAVIAAYREAEELAKSLDVDARRGSTAKIRKRADNPQAWDQVAAAYEKAEIARRKLDEYCSRERERPDRVALDLLDHALAAVHCDPRLDDAPRVLDFVTAIRNVVMAAQPGMTLKEMLQPFHINGGGRPPKVDPARIRKTRRNLESSDVPAPARQTAQQHGVSTRTVRRVAPKKSSTE